MELQAFFVPKTNQPTKTKSMTNTITVSRRLACIELPPIPLECISAGRVRHLNRIRKQSHRITRKGYTGLRGSHQ